jgi:hypothetical protein
MEDLISTRAGGCGGFAQGTGPLSIREGVGLVAESAPRLRPRPLRKPAGRVAASRSSGDSRRATGTAKGWAGRGVGGTLASCDPSGIPSTSHWTDAAITV